MSKRATQEYHYSSKRKKVEQFDQYALVRFEDIHKQKENEWAQEREKTPKSKKKKADLKYFKSFKKMDTKKIKLELFNYEKTHEEILPQFHLAKPGDVNLRRNRMTFPELISFLYDNETLDALIEWNVANKSGLPGVLYKNDLRKKRQMVLKFLICKLYMNAQPRAHLRDYFRNRANSGRVIPDGKMEFSMSERQFQKMHQNFHHPLQLYSLFNKRFASMVHTGCFACFDEKKKPCPEHHLHAKCPKKTWCHWISELAVVAPLSGLPYLLMAFPVTHVAPVEHTDEPFNNLRNYEILMQAVPECDPDSILVYDSHYLDLQGKKALDEEHRYFLAKANPGWWPELVKEASQHLNSKKKNDFVVLHSETFGEHFMMYNSVSGKKMKKKCVLTNAFLNTDAPANYTGLNTIKLAYAQNFNVNDVFNHYLASRYFPNIQKNGWEGNYTDFMYAAYQMNAYTLWHEIQEFKKPQHLSCVAFTRMVYRELMEKFDALEDSMDDSN
jgi:hypothetical protein